MIVRADTLAVMPVADEILRRETGEYVADATHEDIDWSNELVLHVLELKTASPEPRIEGLAAGFQQHIRRVNDILAEKGGRLMPGGMHPWMDPCAEMRLWPHDNEELYRAFDRIFGCRGHGWSNLQSVHLNLPFEGDEEFGRLHAAIRLVLPILPALAASSPLMDGRITGTLDNRLAVYRTNCATIPSLTGRVIPEPVFTVAGYQREILQRCYRDISPHDPEGLLQDEFINARGAIARFCRNTIEIRLLDMQESPQADLAICAAIVAVLKALVEERWGSCADQQAWAIEPLEQILLATIRHADGAVISSPAYLRALGMCSDCCTAGELWAHLIESTLFASRVGIACQPAMLQTGRSDSEFRKPLDLILREGPLARRILTALGPAPDRAHINAIYARLCECLQKGVLFTPDM